MLVFKLSLIKPTFIYILLNIVDAAGPVNNILVVRRENDSSNHISSNVQASSRKQGSNLPPPLEKYANSIDDDSDMKTMISLGGGRKSVDPSYISSHVISNYIKELQVCESWWIVLLIKEWAVSDPDCNLNSVFNLCFSIKVQLLLLKWRWRN